MEVVTKKIQDSLINCQDFLTLRRSEVGELYHFILANTPAPKMQKYNVWQRGKKNFIVWPDDTTPPGDWIIVNSFELPI
jgi:hypothetical protein